MDGPGTSLFQGGDSIRLNNSNQREEEEFLQEEKIRQAELQNLIDNAFSDLDDDLDTDSSISSSRCSRPGQSEYSHAESSTNGSSYSNKYHSKLNYLKEEHGPVKETFNRNGRVEQALPYPGYGEEDKFSGSNYVSAHNNHCFHGNLQPTQATDHLLQDYKHTALNSTDQMKVLYEVRLREIERLTKELEAEKEEKVLISRQLSVCEHDKKNLEISLNANKTLLAESRKEVSELQNKILNLEEKIKDLEKTRDKVQSELEITRTQLSHEKDKFAVLERTDLNIKREKQMDALIESLKSKHRSEIMSLQQELDAALEKINKKEGDLNALERKLEEMEQKHASNLLNKCDSTIRQEAAVKILLDEANKDKLELMKKVNALQEECNMLKTDLDQYDSFPKLRLNNSSSDEKETDSFILLSSGWKNDSKRKGANLTQSDLINKLKEELHRALMGNRTKRKEIMKLQELIQSKEVEINRMREHQSHYLSETENLRVGMASKRTKENEQAQLIIKLQTDLLKKEKEWAIKDQEISDFEKEVKSLKEKLKYAEENLQKQRSEYMEFHEKEVSKVQKDSESLLKEKELEWGRELEKLLSECNEVKQLYLEVKSKKDELHKKVMDLSQMLEVAKEEKLSLEKALKEKQEIIRQLEEHILHFGKVRNEKEDNSLKEVEKELHSIVEKQNVEINLLKNKLDDASKTDEQLNRLKDEISQSKIRYIELEQVLRKEFQVALIKLKDENASLMDTLKKKEAELSLRKMCLISERRDVAVGTEDALIIETLNEQNLTEINKLEKEIDRLKALDEAKSQEILGLKTTYEQKLLAELQKLEKVLADKHQEDIILAEKKVKELTLKYFSEEMEKLQAQYSTDLKKFRDDDYKKIDELKNLLDKKGEEVKSLEKRKEQLEALVKRYEEERMRAAAIMAQWAKEVEQIKNEKEKLVLDKEEMKKSFDEISVKYEELKLKLKETRKAALVYKRRIQEVKSSLSEKYKNLIIDIQKKVEDVVSAREVEIREKLQQIEHDYQGKGDLYRIDGPADDIV